MLDLADKQEHLHLSETFILRRSHADYVVAVDKGKPGGAGVEHSIETADAGETILFRWGPFLGGGPFLGKMPLLSCRVLDRRF